MDVMRSKTNLSVKMKSHYCLIPSTGGVNTVGESDDSAQAPACNEGEISESAPLLTTEAQKSLKRRKLQCVSNEVAIQRVLSCCKQDECYAPWPVFRDGPRPSPDSKHYQSWLAARCVSCGQCRAKHMTLEGRRPSLPTDPKPVVLDVLGSETESSVSVEEMPGIAPTAPPAMELEVPPIYNSDPSTGSDLSEAGRPESDTCADPPPPCPAPPSTSGGKAGEVSESPGVPETVREVRHPLDGHHLTKKEVRYLCRKHWVFNATHETTTSDMVKERRIVSDRNVQVADSLMVIGHLHGLRIHPRLLLHLTAFIGVVLTYALMRASSQHCPEHWATVAAIVGCAVVATSLVVRFFAYEEFHIFYIPHLVTCVLNDCSIHGSWDVEQINIDARRRRYAALPVTDAFHRQLHVGSVEVCESVLKTRDSFRVGRLGTTTHAPNSLRWVPESAR